MTFKDKVLQVVAQIPKGQTLSYKQVATAAGSPKAYRVVGSIMKANFKSSIPCHRVIKSNGQVGEYNRGSNLKVQRLIAEGAISG